MNMQVLLALVASLLLFWLQVVALNLPPLISNDLPNGYEVNLNTSTVTGFDGNVFESAVNATEMSIDDPNAQNYVHRWERLRERNKQQHIALIRAQILDRLGLVGVVQNGTTPIISEEDRRRMIRIFEELRLQSPTQNVQDVYAERVQSFYPSCALPRNTDRDLWDNRSAFHVYYMIPSPKTSPTTTLSVSSAKLRLFKEPAVVDVDEEVEPDVVSPRCTGPCDRDPDGVLQISHTTEERLRISVFQYVRPLRKNKRTKKRLVDSKMVAANHEGWLELDVRTAVREWLGNNKSNFGLQVVLEDSMEKYHNPANFFRRINCSEGVRNPATVLLEPVGFGPTNDSNSLFSNQTYPTLDLRTVEVLGTEAATVHGNEVNRRRRRRRRHSDTLCREEKDNNSTRRSSCCLLPYTVSFAEEDMDLWIISPQSFTTAACIGRCAPRTRIRQTKKKAVCSPDKTQHLPLLVLNQDGTPSVITLDNFIVKSCKCRRYHHNQQMREV